MNCIPKPVKEVGFDFQNLKLAQITAVVPASSVKKQHERKKASGEVLLAMPTATAGQLKAPTLQSSVLQSKV